MTVINPREVADAGYIKDFRDDLVQPNSIDLRVENVYEIRSGIVLHADGERELPDYQRVVPRLFPRGSRVAEYIVFEPGHLYQVEFMETLKLPGNICGISVLRSSMFKSGASGESGLFDSGYAGRTGMSLHVKFESRIEVGAAIAQLIFMDTESSRLYEGHYGNGRPGEGFLSRLEFQ